VRRDRICGNEQLTSAWHYFLLTLLLLEKRGEFEMPAFLGVTQCTNPIIRAFGDEKISKTTMAA
jgi:hypothetical protein